MSIDHHYRMSIASPTRRFWIRGTSGCIPLLVSFAILALLVMQGCKKHSEWSTDLPGTASNKSNLQQPATMELQTIESSSIDNLFRMSPRLYSGSQPHGEASFAQLQKLGVKTIISVDGAKPDIEGAGKYGIRYVHLPIGYDGIDDAKAALIAKASKSVDGPVFFHCHHGKHRGPAAAALAGVMIEGWSNDQACEWMQVAGTSKNYAGLYQSVQRFKTPTDSQLSSMTDDFPSVTKVPPLADAMAQMDRTFDHLKASEQIQFSPPPDHPDLSPPHEALQLTEHFRELLRQPEMKTKPADYQLWMNTGLNQAESLHTALVGLTDTGKPKHLATAKQAVANMKQTCKRCHVKYRN